MRWIVASALSLAALVAVAAAPLPQGGEAAPRNLKVLKPDELRTAMLKATQGLGLRCDACHVAGDFASDEKHKKATARRMFEMTREINAKFPDGKEHVTCYTCHRGAEKPLTSPPEAGAAREKE